MTTPPVVSITDELIAELEAAANETGGIEWHASTAYCSKSERESRAIYHRPSPSVCVEIIETPDSDPENGESIHAEEYWKYLGLANPATILALLAERAGLKQQLAAASVDAERWRDIVQSVADEIPHRSAVRGNAPGHGHDVPGIWDSDNGPLAGKECAWCKTWHSALDAARDIAAMDIGSGD